MVSTTKIALLMIVLFVSGGLLALFLSDQGILVFGENQEDNSRAEFATAIIERKDLRTFKDLDGILEYSNTVPVLPSGTGILTYIAPEGSELSRGSVVLRFYDSSGDAEILVADQQVASANAMVAQAELSLENLNSSATEAQIASADAAVAQATLALENLTTPPTSAHIASADSAVAQAELAFENLNASPTDAQFASSDAAISQAEASLFAAEVRVERDWISYRIARKEYCEKAKELDLGSWIYLDSLCPEDNLPLTDDAIKAVQDYIFAEDQITPFSDSLLNQYKNYASSVESKKSAKKSLESAQAQRSALGDSPTDAQLSQANAALKSAREQRFALDDPPTDAQFSQANAALKSAREQRSALDDTPTYAQISQATYSLENAQAVLETALANRRELTESSLATVLMFGDVPMWRELREGISAGHDVAQLKQNLLLLGYGSVGYFNVDQNFDTSTSDAVNRMQVDLGLAATGRIGFGDVVFLPGPAFIEYTSDITDIGIDVNPNTELATLTPTEKIEVAIGSNGDISTVSESLQRVRTSIEVADQDLIDIGTKVEVELPDESLITGTINEIASVAVIPTGNQASDPYLEVYVSIDGDTGLPEWTGAPVTVSVTKSLAENVLTAPVASLLALLGGGYAVELPDTNPPRLIPVELGVYADGWVELNGPGLEVGTEVLVPR